MAMGRIGRSTNSNATPKPHESYYLGWILKIAAAATVELPEASQAAYLERLQKLSAEEIQRAATQTIEDWREPSKMPPIPFILERARADYKMLEHTRVLLERGDKPPDWTSPEDAKAFIERVKREAKK